MLYHFCEKVSYYAVPYKVSAKNSLDIIGTILVLESKSGRFAR